MGGKRAGREKGNWWRGLWDELETWDKGGAGRRAALLPTLEIVVLARRIAGWVWGSCRASLLSHTSGSRVAAAVLCSWSHRTRLGFVDRSF